MFIENVKMQKVCVCVMGRFRGRVSVRGDRCVHAVCCRAKNWIHLDDGRL